jgi:hypothetical protein
MWTVSPGVQAEQDDCATLRLRLVKLPASPIKVTLFAQ